MLVINNSLTIPQSELHFQFIRAQGAGGQHVNKASTAVNLRFDFLNSPSLPDYCKKRLLHMHDSRITSEGAIVIKAQRFRSQEMNREDAMHRLAELVRAATVTRKKRRPTAPTKASKLRRLETKTKQARIKRLRRPVTDNHA